MSAPSRTQAAAILCTVSKRSRQDTAILVPISAVDYGVDLTKRRFAQILEHGLEPPLPGVVMHQIPLSGGEYVFVVRVPPSFQRPHRYWHDKHTRWVVRSGTHTVDMTYEQIRDAFDRGATLADRARRFREQRLSGIVSGTTGRPLMAGPRCVVHLIPLASMAGNICVDVRSLYYEGYQEFMFSDWGGATRDFNLDGLVVYPGKPTADIAYTQIFRTGEFEAARYAAALNVQDPGEETLMWSETLSDLIRGAITRFLAACNRWHIAGPAIAAAAFLDVSGYRFVYQPPHNYTRKLKSDRPNLILPEVWIEQLAGVRDPDEFARPLLDTLWQSFGLERCMFYDDQNRWIGANP